eukprot:TRINITY_DN8726_c0_g1_i6.p1 TRINITY_DN8726_c0_g1~~TRINITY_DN8726_c0_g1_i6.p1  ORF type:complete len:237 (-),score=31.72 TRINITY_DN8726_c0_g1_i6:12-722(-)
MGASSCCAKRGDDEEREVSKLPQNVASSGNLRPPPPRPAQSATPGGPEAEEAFPEVGPDSPEFEPQPRGLNSLSIPSLNFSNLRRRPEPDGQFDEPRSPTVWYETPERHSARQSARIMEPGVLEPSVCMQICARPWGWTWRCDHSLQAWGGMGSAAAESLKWSTSSITRAHAAKAGNGVDDPLANSLGDWYRNGEPPPDGCTPRTERYSLCLDDSIKPSDFKSVEDDMKAEENETK